MTSTSSEVDISTFEEIVAHLDKPWKILVWDDDVNTMEYVVAVFMKHFKLGEDAAMLKMLEVHQDGKSILDVGSRDEMLVHKKAMNDYGLQATVEQDS